MINTAASILCSNNRRSAVFPRSSCLFLRVAPTICSPWCFFRRAIASFSSLKIQGGLSRVIVNKLNCRYVVVCGRYVVGVWSVCGLYVVGMWSVCGLYVVGMWSVRGRYVIGTWSVCGRYVVGSVDCHCRSLVQTHWHYRSKQSGIARARRSVEMAYCDPALHPFLYSSAGLCRAVRRTVRRSSGELTSDIADLHVLCLCSRTRLPLSRVKRARLREAKLTARLLQPPSPP